MRPQHQGEQYGGLGYAFQASKLFKQTPFLISLSCISSLICGFSVSRQLWSLFSKSFHLECSEFCHLLFSALGFHPDIWKTRSYPLNESCYSNRWYYPHFWNRKMGSKTVTPPRHRVTGWDLLTRGRVGFGPSPVEPSSFYNCTTVIHA